VKSRSQGVLGEAVFTHLCICAESLDHMPNRTR
jgi:hypothetical protein